MRSIPTSRVPICVSAALWAILAATTAAQPRRELAGRLFWVDDDGERRAASGVEVVSQAGDSTLTDDDGAFRLPLGPAFRPGETLGVSVDVDGWFVGTPADGELRIPYASDPAAAEVELYRAGSERFWSDERIEKFLLETADLALERLDSTQERPGIDFEFYVRRWARQHGWTADKAHGHVDAWLAQAEAGVDPFRGGLAALTRGDLEKAAERFRAAARATEQQFSEPRGSTREDEVEQLTRRAGRSYGLEGAALFLAGKLDESVEAYKLALRRVSRQDSPQLWAATLSNTGTVVLERAIHPDTPPATRAEQLPVARQSFEAVLVIFTRESFPLAWAAAQHSQGRTLAHHGWNLRGDVGMAYLRQAVHVLDGALEVRTRESLPDLWASTQTQRLATLVHQGLRTPGEAGRRTIEATLGLYYDVAAVRTYEQSPELWARTRFDLAYALDVLGEKTPGRTGERYYEEAVEQWRKIIEADLPHQSAESLRKIHEELSQSLVKRAEREGSADRASWYGQAIEAWRRTLALVDRESDRAVWVEFANQLAATFIQGAKVEMDEEKRLRMLEEGGGLADIVSAEALVVENSRVAMLSLALMAESRWLRGRAGEAVLIMRETLRGYPEYRGGFLILHNWAYAHLRDFELAYQTLSSWAEAHPTDLRVRVSLTLDLFTTGRFEPCVEHTDALRRNPLVALNDRAFLLVFEIASRRVLRHPDKQVADLLRLLARALARLQPRVNAPWLDQTLLSYLETEESLEPHRKWLSNLFGILGNKDRDSVVAALEELAASLELPQA